jgi:hypothetical protein
METPWVLRGNGVVLKQKRTLGFLLVCFLLLCGFSGPNVLPLPPSAKPIIDRIAEQCGDCLKNGFSPTGTDRIGFGKISIPIQVIPMYIKSTNRAGKATFDGVSILRAPVS